MNSRLSLLSIVALSLLVIGKTQIICPDGTEVGNVQNCPQQIVCPSASPFYCFATNTCFAIPTDCSSRNITCTNLNVICWNGECATSFGKCEPLPACPYGTKRCFDGTCGTTCPASVACTSGTRCPDGTCSTSSCVQYDGCGVDQFECPDGSCVSSVSACSCTSGGNNLQCFDNSCQADHTNCKPAPFKVKVLEITQDVPAGNTTRIRILSADRTSTACTITVPVGTFTGSPKFEVKNIADSIVKTTPPRSGWPQSNPEHFIFSTVVDVAFADGQSQTFMGDISVSCEVLLPYGVKSLSDACLAVMNVAGQWQCVDTKPLIGVSSSGPILEGKLRQLGTLAFVRDDKATDEPSASSSSNKTTIIIAVVVSVGGALLIGVIVGLIIFFVRRRKNDSSSEEMDQKRKSWSSASSHSDD